jgi:hypothetical protein
MFYLAPVRGRDEALLVPLALLPLQPCLASVSQVRLVLEYPEGEPLLILIIESKRNKRRVPLSTLSGIASSPGMNADHQGLLKLRPSYHTLKSTKKQQV